VESERPPVISFSFSRMVSFNPDKHPPESRRSA
jgi:hypothetical protein